MKYINPYIPLNEMLNVDKTKIRTFRKIIEKIIKEYIPHSKFIDVTSTTDNTYDKLNCLSNLFDKYFNTNESIEYFNCLITIDDDIYQDNNNTINKSIFQNASFTIGDVHKLPNNQFILKNNMITFSMKTSSIKMIDDNPSTILDKLTDTFQHEYGHFTLCNTIINSFAKKFFTPNIDDFTKLKTLNTIIPILTKHLKSNSKTYFKYQKYVQSLPKTNDIPYPFHELIDTIQNSEKCSIYDITQKIDNNDITIDRYIAQFILNKKDKTPIDELFIDMPNIKFHEMIDIFKKNMLHISDHILLHDISADEISIDMPIIIKQLYRLYHDKFKIINVINSPNQKNTGSSILDYYISILGPNNKIISKIKKKIISNLD